MCDERACYNRPFSVFTKWERFQFVDLLNFFCQSRKKLTSFCRHIKIKITYKNMRFFDAFFFGVIN